MLLPLIAVIAIKSYLIIFARLIFIFAKTRKVKGFQADKNMTETKKTNSKDEFKKLLDKDEKIINIPSPGDLIKGKVLTVSKNEVRLDIDGITTGIVRSRELYNELEEYGNLKEGDEVEATVLELDNENGEMELSFKVAGQQKTWDQIKEAFTEKKIIKAKVKEANRGGLIVKLFSVDAFLPVSQLSPEHYPKVQGGDKGKILEKLKRLISQDVSVKIMNISEKEEMVIVSEKEAATELQNEVVANFKKDEIVEGVITAITDFGAFVKIDKKINDGEEESMNFAEGLIHISEVAWQKIENLREYLKENQRVRAKIINIYGTKIFLSMKQLLKDPWTEVKDKYTIGQSVNGKVMKINPYGIIIKLDNEIQGLCHISELSSENTRSMRDIGKIVKIGDEKEFIIISMDCDNHRIGLSLKESKEGEKAKVEEAKEEGAKIEEGEGEEEEKEKDNEGKKTKEKDKKSKRGKAKSE